MKFVTIRAQWNIVSIGLGDDLSPDMRQANKFTNDNRFHWPMRH